jgi:hypothetical protein
MPTSFLLADEGQSLRRVYLGLFCNDFMTCWALVLSLSLSLSLSQCSAFVPFSFFLSFFFLNLFIIITII